MTVMTDFHEFIQALIAGELPWEVWEWELPEDPPRRHYGPFEYRVVSRHRTQNAAINSKNRQPPAPASCWYRVIDRRWPHLESGVWRERVAA
ncbi:hypothetical protein [Nocardia sp. NPDC057227]|uniref:hypothetical protein n=1 Tax=Nocardia sp. NPDC057227 TaxID=3346056 RepID=UPI003644A95F